MAEDIDKVERARLACEEIIDHMDCDVRLLSGGMTRDG